MTEALLSLLIEFDDQVRRDQSQSPVFLHRRDRKFAIACNAAGQTPGPRQWLDHLHSLNPVSPSPASPAPLVRWRAVAWGFGLVGALLGVITMLGLLFYDGGQQINVTVILAFIALQLGLALLTTLQSLIGWQPWGRLAAWLTAHSAGQPERPALSRLQPTMMAGCAHLGGLAFGLTGGLTLLTLVVVQDLAFGWSSTLTAGADAYHQLVVAISTPWHSLWPAAVPSADLVRDSRFFRIESASAVVPARWGDWWPFLAMAWLCYVVIPRATLLLAARIQLAVQARLALRQHPGLAALMYRMETPALDTGDGHADASDAPDLATRHQVRPLPASPVRIHWAGADEGLRWPEPPDDDKVLVLQAGGTATLARDRQVLQQARLRLTNERHPTVTVVTRAWQPPTGELADFLADARQAWPDGTLIALVPVGADANPVEPAQLDQWLRFVDRLPSPSLQLCQPASDNRADAREQAAEARND